MIQKNPADAFAAMMEMIDEMHRVIVLEDADLPTIADAAERAAKKLDRPRVIDGGKVD